MQYNYKGACKSMFSFFTNIYDGNSIFADLTVIDLKANHALPRGNKAYSAKVRLQSYPGFF